MRLVALALSVVIFLTTGAARLPLLKAHFSHIDDIGVAVTVVEAKKHPVQLSTLVAEAEQKIGAGRNSPRLNLLLALARSRVGSSAFAVLAPAYPAVVVPLKMTYAPLQMLVTSALVRPGQSYESTKVWGRLPSLLASFGTLAILVGVLFRAAPDRWPPLVLVAAAMTGCSLEYTIMAVQMHTYAAGAAAAAAMMLLAVLFKARDARFDARSIGLFAVGPAALCYVSYQSILLLPGLFLGMAGAAVFEPNERSAARRLVKVTAFAMITGALVAPAYVFRIRDVNAVGWNAGPRGEFLLHRSAGGLIENLGETVGFFMRNGWIALQSLVAPLPEGHPLLPILVALVLGLVLLGLAVLARSLAPRTWRALSTLATLVLVSLVLFGALVAAGRLTLSPTRHLVVYLPLIVVAAALGLDAVGEGVNRAARLNVSMGSAVLAATFAGLFLTAYFSHFTQFVRERRDPFDEGRLTQFARTEHAALVVGYDATLQPFVMPALRKAVQVADLDDLGPTPVWRGFTGPINVLLVSHRRPATEADCVALLGRLGRARNEACLAATQARELANEPSPVELEYSRRTRNGTNGFFLSRLTVR